MKHFFEKIRGYFNYADLYAEMVEKAEDGSLFVELGAWKGCSAAFLAVEIENSGKSIRLDVVDNFQGLYQERRDISSLENFRRNYQECLTNLLPVPQVRVIGLPSPEASSLYAAESIDFIFIDANHTYKHVKQDIELWYPKVKPGGILAGHDYGNKDYPGVKQAVDELLPGSEPVSKVSWIYYKPK